MLELKLHTCFVVVHLIGLGIGAGGAIITDLYVFRRAVLTKIDKGVVETVDFLGHMVAFGLLLLWISGIALTIELMMVKPQFVTNQKFWGKVAIVILLTLNGINIHNQILPILQRRIGRTIFEGMPPAGLMLLAGSGAVSFVSWVFPIVLGAAKEMSYVTPFYLVMLVYLAATSMAIAMSYALVARVLPRILPHAEIQARAGAGIEISFQERADVDRMVRRLRQVSGLDPDRRVAPVRERPASRVYRAA